MWNSSSVGLLRHSATHTGPREAITKPECTQARISSLEGPVSGAPARDRSMVPMRSDVNGQTYLLLKVGARHQTPSQNTRYLMAPNVDVGRPSAGDHGQGHAYRSLDKSTVARGLATRRLRWAASYSSKLRSIQAVFSCTCMRWVSKSHVG